MAALGQRVSTQIGKTTQKDRQIEKREERERERVKNKQQDRWQQKKTKEAIQINCEKMYQRKKGLSNLIRPSMKNTVQKVIKITKAI